MVLIQALMSMERPKITPKQVLDFFDEIPHSPQRATEALAIAMRMHHDEKEHFDECLAKAAIEAGADVNVDIDTILYRSTGLPALYVAALISSKSWAMPLLLERGANANIRARNGETPLMKASLHGYIKSMKLLIDHGADVNASNHHDQTPLELATLTHHTEAADVLLDHGAFVLDPSVLLQAVQGCSIALVKRLLEKGADPNRIGSCLSQSQRRLTKGRTALMEAAEVGGLEKIQLLLKYGAAKTINVQDEGHTTALQEAVDYQRLEIAQLLLENGADCNIRSEYHSPLESAIYTGRIDMVQLLLSHNARIDSRILATAKFKYDQEKKCLEDCVKDNTPEYIEWEISFAKQHGFGEMSLEEIKSNRETKIREYTKRVKISAEILEILNSAGTAGCA